MPFSESTCAYLLQEGPVRQVVVIKLFLGFYLCSVLGIELLANGFKITQREEGK